MTSLWARWSRKTSSALCCVGTERCSSQGGFNHCKILMRPMRRRPAGDVYTGQWLVSIRCNCVLSPFCPCRRCSAVCWVPHLKNVLLFFTPQRRTAYLSWRRRLWTPPTWRRPSRPSWQVRTHHLWRCVPSPSKHRQISWSDCSAELLWSALRAAGFTSLISQGEAEWAE